jgi:hypothetical protein
MTYVWLPVTLIWSTFPTFSAKVEPDDEEMLRQRALHLRALNLEPPGDVLSGSPVVTRGFTKDFNMSMWRFPNIGVPHGTPRNKSTPNDFGNLQ